MNTQGTLADLRRLYHHLINDGEFHQRIDTERIARAIRTIEEFDEGSCRFNCRTGKARFAQGVEWGIGFLPDGWEEEYRKIQKEDK